MRMTLLGLLALAAIACSEGNPPTAPPPQDASLVVSFSSDNATGFDQAEIVIEIVGMVALSDGGQDVDVGGFADEINLVDLDGSPIELVRAQVEPGDFTGIEVEFAPDGFVRRTPGEPAQDMTLTETLVTASGAFSIQDGGPTEIELILDLDGRLTFDDETAMWELDPRRLDLLN